MTDSDLTKELTLDAIGSRTNSKASNLEPEITLDAEGSGTKSKASNLEPEITLDAKESRTNSKASDLEPEIAFNKSASGFSTDDPSTAGPSPDGKDNTGPSRPESSTDYLMTAQEIQELDHRLEEVIDNLQRQREDYEHWEKGLNKRRMEAYGRLKALGKFHKQRMDVYDTVKDYLQTMNVNGLNRTSKK